MNMQVGEIKRRLLWKLKQLQQEEFSLPRHIGISAGLAPRSIYRNALCGIPLHCRFDIPQVY